MKNGGYVALISTILISAVLLAMLLSKSTAGFLYRFNILADEEKLYSYYLAKSCLEIALLRSTDPQTISIGADQCQILSIDKLPSDNFLVKTSASGNNTFTNLVGLVETSDNIPTLVSIKEI